MNHIADTKREFNEIIELIEGLLNGCVSPAKFRSKINQYSENKVCSLFRDSFPKFDATIKKMILKTFKDYFFPNEYETHNLFMKFVDYKNFFPELKDFHDNTYFKGMSIKEIVNIFSDRLKKKNSFTPLEKKFLLLLSEQIKLEKHIVFNDIAKKLGVSNKRITMIINNLKTKGITLGAVVNWKKLGIQEQIIRKDIENTNSIITKRVLMLFPNSKINVIATLKEVNDAEYQIINKQYLFNIEKIINKKNVLSHYKLIEQFKKPKDKDNCEDIQLRNNEVICPGREKKIEDYMLDLIINCEKDFKKPNFKQITENHKVSERTLTRTKQRFIEKKIITPRIRVDNKNLVKVLVFTKIQQTFLNKVLPTIEEYLIEDKHRKRLWFYIFQVWKEDIEDLLKILKREKNCYVIIDEKIKHIGIKKRKEKQEEKLIISLQV